MRKNGAQLYGPRVSDFLSHRKAKSLIVMISGKFKFQCIRHCLQNHPFCPGSPQNTFIFLICQNLFFDNLEMHAGNLTRLEDLRSARLEQINICNRAIERNDVHKYHSGPKFEPLAKGSQRFRFKPNSAEPFPTGSDANLFEPF